MANLKKEMMNFLKSLRFYLYTEGHDEGMSNEERSDVVKKIITFNENNQEWLESNFDFDFRLMNVLKCLDILLEKNPNKKYVEEVVLEKDIEFLKEFPVQELIYRTFKLRKLILNTDNDLTTTFNLLVEKLFQLFEYLEENPGDAKIYFAIMIGLFSQIDKVSKNESDLKPIFHNTTELFYLSEYYNAIYGNMEEKISILNLISAINDDINSINILLENKNSNDNSFSEKIAESLNLIRNVLSSQIANSQLHDKLFMRERDTRVLNVGMKPIYTKKRKSEL